MSRPRKPTKRYNREKLIEIGKDRGFYSTESFYIFLMSHLGYGKGVNKFRIKLAREQFTWTQLKLIASCLMMSDQEFIDVFFSDTFTIETPGGRRYAHLDESEKQEMRLHYDRPGRYRHHKGGGKPPKETIEDRRKSIDELLENILNGETKEVNREEKNNNGNL